MQAIQTGTKGLDDLLGGGFPKGKCILVVGSPGAGKTILLMQFLKSGALADERGLYVTMDETPEQIKNNLSSFGWNIDKLEEEGKLLFLDATMMRQSGLRRQSGLLLGHEEITSEPRMTVRFLVETLSRIIKEEDIQRIAIDPITSIMLRYDQPSRRRRAMLMFFESLTESGCTSLVSTELRTSMLRRAFQLEEFLSQGVILMHMFVHSGNVIRAIQVEKMRGTAHDTQLRPYQITSTGVEVYPKDRVF
ncbi:AAA family ATPase [Candidatus Bathyarchaeota archaeon]|nr:AAA family ATPase [Candidatus Bathyarchaeota archaeon]